MFKLAILLVLSFIPANLLAQDYASIFHDLVHSEDARTTLDSIEDPNDFALSLTVGQIMLMPSETQLMFMRSVPMYLLDSLFIRDGINITPYLSKIDFTDPKVLTLAENYFLAVIEDALEDIQIASESKFENQLMTFRGPFIRDKYKFFRDNLFTNAMDSITDLLVTLQKNQMPISARFLKGVEKTIKSASSKEVIATFATPEGVLLYPEFFASYEALLQSTAQLAFYGEVENNDLRLEFMDSMRNIFAGSFTQMMEFSDKFGTDFYEPSPSFYDEPQLDSDAEREEWGLLVNAIENFENWALTNMGDESSEEEVITDAYRELLDTNLAENMFELFFKIINFEKDFSGEWTYQKQEQWTENLRKYLGEKRPFEYPSKGSSGDSAHTLSFLSKLTFDDFQAPKKMIFKTVNAAKIIIHQDTDGTESVYYPKEFDQAAQDLLITYAYENGIYPVGLESFKRLVQIGWGNKIVTQGAFVMQNTNLDTTSYAAAFESNGINWDSDLTDELMFFEMSQWDVYLQPETNRKRALLVIENETQWDALKEKVKKLSAKMGVDATRVPISKVVAAASNIIKADNPHGGVYSKDTLNMASDGQGLSLKEKKNCLSFFQKKNNLSED